MVCRSNSAIVTVTDGITDNGDTITVVIVAAGVEQPMQMVAVTGPKSAAPVDVDGDGAQKLGQREDIEFVTGNKKIKAVRDRGQERSPVHHGRTPSSLGLWQVNKGLTLL